MGLILEFFIYIIAHIPTCVISIHLFFLFFCTFVYLGLSSVRMYPFNDSFRHITSLNV